MPWPDLIIFDCDGVLVDSEPIALGQVRRALGEAGWTLTHAEAIDRLLGFSLDSIMQKAEAELSAALPAEFRSDLSRAILARFATELKGIEGVSQVVSALTCKVCVASSSPLDRIRLALSVAGYDALFEPHIFFRDHGVARQAASRLVSSCGPGDGNAARPMPGDRGQCARRDGGGQRGHAGVRLRRRQPFFPDRNNESVCAEWAPR